MSRISPQYLEYADCMPQPSLQAMCIVHRPSVLACYYVDRCAVLFLRFYLFLLWLLRLWGCSGKPCLLLLLLSLPHFFPSLTLRNFTQLNLTWLLCLSPYCVVGCDLRPVYPLRSSTVLNWRGDVVASIEINPICLSVLCFFTLLWVDVCNWVMDHTQGLAPLLPKDAFRPEKSYSSNPRFRSLSKLKDFSFWVWSPCGLSWLGGYWLVLVFGFLLDITGLGVMNIV